MTSAVERAAARLRSARKSVQPCEPIRHLLPGASLHDAYEVQRLNMDASLAEGRRRVGWKVGLTNPAVQRQLGVEQPDFGPIWADEAMLDGLPVDASRLIQPRVEAEVAFVLDRAIDAGPVTVPDVLAATAFLLPAIEVVDSRVVDWDISIVDTVADDASSGLHVLGGTPIRPSNVDLRRADMTMSCGTRMVSEGSGEDCLAHPVNAVVWLANTLLGLGQSLQARDVVLSGALGPMAAVEPSTTYEASIDGVGSVRAVFSEEES